MTPTQLILIIIGTLLFIMTSRLFYKERLTFAQATSWNILWIGLVSAALFVDNLSIVSKLTGIERPVDLIVYLSIVLMFIYIYKLNLKIEQVHRDVTKVVRSQAIKNVKEKSPINKKVSKTK